MIKVDEIIDSLISARIAYLVTVSENNDIMAVIVGGNNLDSPSPEQEIIHALDAILTGEQQQPNSPQVLSNWIGLNEPNDEVILN